MLCAPDVPAECDADLSGFCRNAVGVGANDEARFWAPVCVTCELCWLLPLPPSSPARFGLDAALASFLPLSEMDSNEGLMEIFLLVLATLCIEAADDASLGPPAEGLKELDDTDLGEAGVELPSSLRKAVDVPSPRAVKLDSPPSEPFLADATSCCCCISPLRLQAWMTSVTLLCPPSLARSSAVRPCFS